MAGNRDDVLMLALARGETVRDAAVSAGMSERTAARRWADPAFRLRVSHLRGEMLVRAAGKLADAMSEAADELRQLMKEAKSETVRLAACRTALELGLKSRETLELDERLRQLEDANREALDALKK
jgi:hypothetical protein